MSTIVQEKIFLGTGNGLGTPKTNTVTYYEVNQWSNQLSTSPIPELVGLLILQ
ncbi:hypothetical protein FRB93_006907, partial [Tulasnella sp. JGI-2019a]